MKYCTNCGEELEQDAEFCTKCGTAVSKQDSVQQDSIQEVSEENSKKSGLGTASMILGIIAIVVGVITFFLAVAMVIYANSSVSWNLYSSFSSRYTSELLSGALAMDAFPAILSIPGLIFGIISRTKVKNGSNMAGIVLNAITIGICIIQTIVIMSLGM